jgi:hypothetical protein
VHADIIASGVKNETGESHLANYRFLTPRFLRAGTCARLPVFDASVLKSFWRQKPEGEVFFSRRQKPAVGFAVATPKKQASKNGSVGAKGAMFRAQSGGAFAIPGVAGASAR